jgi:hypothetical protein
MRIEIPYQPEYKARFFFYKYCFLEKGGIILFFLFLFSRP